MFMTRTEIVCANWYVSHRSSERKAYADVLSVADIWVMSSRAKASRTPPMSGMACFWIRVEMPC